MSWSYFEKGKTKEQAFQDENCKEHSMKSIDLIESPELDLYASTPTKDLRIKKPSRRPFKKTKQKDIFYIDLQDSESEPQEMLAEDKKSQTKTRSFERKFKNDSSFFYDNTASLSISNASTSNIVESVSSNSFIHDTKKYALNSNMYKNVKRNKGNIIDVPNKSSSSSTPLTNTTILTNKRFKCLESHRVTISTPITNQQQQLSHSTMLSQSLINKNAIIDINDNETTNQKDEAFKSSDFNGLFLNNRSLSHQMYTLNNNKKNSCDNNNGKGRNARKEFCQKMSMQIELGKGREARRQAGSVSSRQLSCEELLWRSEWADVLWLELQASINGVVSSRQDLMLDLQRRSVTVVLNRLMHFKVQSNFAAPVVTACSCNNYLSTDPSPLPVISSPLITIISSPTDPPQLPPDTHLPTHSSSTTSSNHPFISNCRNIIGTCLNQEISAFTQAAKQVADVMNQVEWVQSLYPNDKALQRGCPQYTHNSLQNRLTCLHMWYDTTLDLVQYIRYVYELVTSTHVKVADHPRDLSLWWCVELAQLNKLLDVLKDRRPEKLQHLISKQSSIMSSDNNYNSKLSSDNSFRSTNSNFENENNNLDILACLTKMNVCSLDEDEDDDDGDVDEQQTADIHLLAENNENLSNEISHNNHHSSSTSNNNNTNNRMNISNNNNHMEDLKDRLPSKASMASSDSFELLPTSSTSFYKKFVDRSLKTSEVRELCKRLHKLLERTLNRSRLVLALLHGGGGGGGDSSGGGSSCGGNDGGSIGGGGNGGGDCLEGLENMDKTSSGKEDKVVSESVEKVYKGLENLREGSKEDSLEKGNKIDNSKKVKIEVESLDESEMEMDNLEEKVKEVEKVGQEVEDALRDAGMNKGKVEDGDREKEIDGGMEEGLEGCMRSMGLPSFRPFFLFLAKVLLDVMHEGLKMRLAQQPKNNSSIESMKPLIKQCKEILRASVLTKTRYVSLTKGITCGEYHEGEMEKFEESLMLMLKIYFDYMNQFTSYLQQVPCMSRQLKDFMGREWSFCKEVCSHIHNGEADAGNKFCSMTSSLLKYISDILNSGIDDCTNKLMGYEEGNDEDDEEDDEDEDEEDEENGDDYDDGSVRGLPRSKSTLFRHRLLQLGRELKEHFNEARDSSMRTVLFARMIKNDLEVVSQYEVVVPVDQLLQDLEITNHVQIITGQRLNYAIFAPVKVANDENLACHLLNVACCSDEHFDDTQGGNNGGGGVGGAGGGGDGGGGGEFGGGWGNIHGVSGVRSGDGSLGDRDNRVFKVISKGGGGAGFSSVCRDSGLSWWDNNINNNKNDAEGPNRSSSDSIFTNDKSSTAYKKQGKALNLVDQNNNINNKKNKLNKINDDDDEEDEDGRGRIRFLSHDSDGELGKSELNDHPFEQTAFQSLNITTKRSHRGNHYSNYLIFMNKSDLVTSSGDPIQWKGPQKRIDPNAEATISLVHVEVEKLILVAVHSSKLQLCRRTLEECVRGDVRMVNEQTSCHQSIVESLNELKCSAMDFQTSLAAGLDNISKRFDSVDFENVQMESLDSDKLHKANKDLINYCYTFAFEYHKEVYRLISGKKREDLGRRMVLFGCQWMLFAQSCVMGRGVKPRWAHQGFDFLRFLMDTNNNDIIKTLSLQQYHDFQSSLKKGVVHIVGFEIPGLETDTSRSPLSDRNPSFSHISYTPSSLSPSRCATPTRSFSSAPASQSYTPLRPRREAWRKAVGRLDRNLDDARLSAKRIGKVTSRTVNSFSSDFKVRKVKFKWHRGNKIGEGQFGKVFSVVNLDSGELLAMKQMKLPLNDYKRMKKIEGEIRILESVSHSSLVQFYGAETFSDELLLFMEFCRNGTLEDLCKEELNEASIRRYACNILNAVYVLHSHNIVHRDIKGANIFVMPNHSIKLGDFGCSVQLKTQDTAPGELNEFVGTPAFMAPEIINGNAEVGYGRSADVWSYGCVILQMCTGKRPWHRLTREQIIFKVGSGVVPEIPERLSEESKEFVGHCLQSEAHNRWSVEQLLEHPFVKVDVDEENDF